MYIAHNRVDGSEEPLIEHLEKTAATAGLFANAFGAGKWGYAAGYLHDIGKYSEAFLRRIRYNGRVVDHSTAGAQVCRDNRFIAYCIAGHHGGLPDGGSTSDTPDMPTLLGKLKRKDLPDYSAFYREVDLKRLEITANPPKNFQTQKDPYFQASFLTRMLFSCLVDADYLNTEAFVKNGSVKRGGYETLHALYVKYFQYIQKFENPHIPIYIERNRILRECVTAGYTKKGLFSLTVPTGGGKTIASLGFALQHADRHPEIQRIIYVIPYTNIIEQTASVFRTILGKENIIEHHSLADSNAEKHRLSAENWDAPVVVTTNVQFFESIYSNTTSKCRKLHNIANSILIFDEVQMIPAGYLYPCIRSIYELTLNYGCTAVLCSATQPAVEDILRKRLDKSIRIPEICPRQEEMHRFFSRVTVRNDGLLDDELLISALEEHRGVLCILNSKEHARVLAESLKGRTDVYHLSTNMTPLHRFQVLRKIKQLLHAKEPCIVISTSLVEAGVDLDFPAVYREYSGIDSIVQAAGRCNRESWNAAKQSIVHVFETDGYPLPFSFRMPIAVAVNIINKYPDIISNEAIQKYFEELYHSKSDAGLDVKDVVGRLNKSVLFPFAAVSEDFKLIDDNTKTVVVPFCTGAHSPLRRSFNLLKRGIKNREIMRDIGKISVSVYEKQYVSLQRAGVLEEIYDGLAILLQEKYYDRLVGLLHGEDTGTGVII